MRPVIFTTGAHLQPMKVKNEDGEEYWIWTVLEFVDDSFKDGEVFNSKETAKSLEILLTE
jgi:hypothetical protein